ncbi:glycosyltransferase family 2 protein [Aequorivita echinoideorum]|uniref:Glycosyltransferase family 2 protein n=1 Tax=Aequorivita echinoideorum TaxID=1549647 RepID=A0ABS5S5F7_9FLAO|nr:glycosyltransferase family 2 protein [Aequorivita echinoideorum]MBT0608441.1 glycosyltransferase family 2 protein [Aequorivita echinoideorum]
MISIILPNYNHKQFLEQRLESILHQTYQDFEIILLDDASNDGSEKILRKYAVHPKVTQFLINNVNSGGPFKQWKKGIEYAKGNYVWIAESDDYCAPDFLEKSIKRLNEEVGLTYCQSIDVDENNKMISERLQYTNIFQPNIWKDDFTISGTAFIDNYLYFRNVIPNASAVLFKKELVSDDIFDKKLLEMKMAGDWLFWSRICKKTCVSFSREVLNFFRNHENVSRNHNSLPKQRQRILEELHIVQEIDNKRKLPTRQPELINKWFSIHSKWHLFKKSFYAPSRNMIKNIQLFYDFVSFKLKK